MTERRERPAKARRTNLARQGRGEAGSITLEASLVVPVVFSLTLAVIVFAVWMLDRALNYYTASAESSKAAFAWSHSSAELSTGAYPPGAYDGLYWRLLDDALLAGLFGWDSGERGIRVEVGDPHSGDASLAESKLHKSAARLSAWPQGAVTYRNQVWKRELIVEGGEGRLPLSLPGLRGLGGSFETAALVTEPAEWVRSFELIRYYRNKFKALDKGSESYREKASDILRGRGRQ